MRCFHSPASWFRLLFIVVLVLWLFTWIDSHTEISIAGQTTILMYSLSLKSWFSIRISLTFVPNDIIKNNVALNQLMAWDKTSHYLMNCRQRTLTQNGPQWLNVPDARQSIWQDIEWGNTIFRTWTSCTFNSSMQSNAYLSPYPEPVYTGWSCALEGHWNATGWTSVH